MTKKLFPNLAEKVKIGFWSLNRDSLSRIFFYLLILFLPTQLGKHFWPDFSFVYGIRLDYLSPTFYFTDLILVLIFLLSFKNIFRNIIKSRYLKIFLIYLLVLFLTGVFSKNIYASLYGLIKLLEFSYLFVFTAINIKKLNKEVLFSLFFVGLFFESFLSLFQVFNNGSLGGLLYLLGERTFTSQTPGIANASINGSLYLRPYETFSHPNELSFYLLASSFLILNFYEKKKYQKKITFISLIISSFAIFLTLSRASFFVWIFDLLVIFYYFFSKTPKNIDKKISIFMLTVFFILLFIISQKNIYLMRFFSVNLTDESLTQRVWLINQTLNIIKNNFLFGVGLNNFYYYLSPFFENSKVFFIQPVHNIYLYVLSETGIIGFLLFGFLFLKAVKTQLQKAIKTNPFLLILFLNILFLGFFDHYLLTLQQGQLLLTLILALCIAG